MQFQHEKDRIVIIDFGSQVTKLIARRIRELGVYSDIITPTEAAKLKTYKNIKGFILSGGPATVTRVNFKECQKNIPTGNTSFGNLLWSTINCKNIWWKNKIFKKKKRIW